MNKELQDHVWSILPDEFKEEVKKIYQANNKNILHPNWKVCDDGLSRTSTLATVFGDHNLTSDEEGEEELLTVQRSKVIDIFTQNTILLSEGHSEYLSGYYNGKCHVLKDLFGSKCLPYEEQNEFKYE